MLYECDHLDCRQRWWVDIKNPREYITCPYCKRRSGVIINFITAVGNLDVPIDSIWEHLKPMVEEARAWIKDEVVE